MKMSYVWMLYKWHIVMVVVVLVLLVVSVSFLFSGEQTVPEEEFVAPTTDPVSFVKENSYNVSGVEDEFLEVDVEQATQGISDLDLGYQSITLPDGRVDGVFLYGSYQGNEPFQTIHLEEDVPKMIVDHRFKTDDGVIQAFALYVDGEILMYIDEDWKQQVAGPYYAVWYGESEEVNEQVIDFSDAGDGVYVGSVKDDFSWLFQDSVEGKFFFGDMSRQEYLSIEDAGSVDFTTVLVI